MARLPKCPECTKEVVKEETSTVKHSNKYYHGHCFKTLEQRKKDRLALFEYICELFRVPKPNGFMLKQIKEFTEEYNYTLKGIELALRYFHDIKGNPVDSKGIGIIPYIYDESKKYYINLSAIKESANIDFSNEAEIVHIANRPKRKRKNYIDIEGIS